MKTRIKIFQCRDGVEEAVNLFLEDLTNFYQVYVNEYFIAVTYHLNDYKRKDTSPKEPN